MIISIHRDYFRLSRSLWLTTTLLLCLVTRSTNVDAEEVRSERILSIEGDQLPEADVVELSGLEVGQQLTRARARQAIRAIWATGHVADVRVLSEPLEGGVAVYLRLRLNQVVRGLEVEYPDNDDDPALSQQDVARAIGYYAGMDWHPESIGSISETLEATYSRRGYPSASVEVFVEEGEEGNLESVSLRLVVLEGEPTRLSEVIFSGQLGLPEAEVREQFGISQGDVYDQVALEDRLRQLLQHYRSEGYYQASINSDRISAVLSGGDVASEARLVIPLSAGSYFDVDFVGNRWLTDDELLDILNLEEEASLTRTILDSLAVRIRDQYRTNGFHHVRVDWRVVQIEPGERRLTFRIRTGPQVRVRQIEFEGNDHFTDRYLRRQIEAQLEETIGAQDLFRRVSDDVASDLGIAGEGHEQWRPRPPGNPALMVNPTEVYLAEAYATAQAHIVDLYSADGYFQVQLSEPELRFHDRGRQLTVTINVEEGPQTLIQSLTFSGNEDLDDDQVFDWLGLSLGDPLDRYEVEQARRRVIRGYQAEGYVYVEVTVADYVSEDGLSSDVRCDVVEGPQVRVGRIIVRGNEATRTELILDRISLREGAVYAPRAAARSERALVDLGIFTTASVSLDAPDEQAAIKNVIVEVEERLPQLLEVRAGFSTADGPRLGLHYGYRNLFGYGLGFDLRLRGSFQVLFFGNPVFEEYVRSLSWNDRLERLVMASFTMPHLPRIGRVVSIRLDATHERENGPAYAVTRNGMALSISTGYKPHLAAQIQTGFLYSDVDQVQNLPNCNDLGNLVPPVEPDPPNNCLWPNDDDKQLSRAPQGASWFWITRALITLDFRDNPFNPTRGFYGSISAEHVYSLVPAYETIESDDPDTPDEEIARQSNLIKLTTTLNGYIPLGWRDLVLALSVRFGWIFPLNDDSYTFPDRFFYLGGFDSMRGYYDESMLAQDVGEPGGNSMLNLRAEFRIPLVSSFALGLFVDAGNSWRIQTNMWDDFALQTCVGLGFRINTPVGPMALDWGFVVDSVAPEKEFLFAIHFAIGLF